MKGRVKFELLVNVKSSIFGHGPRQLAVHPQLFVRLVHYHVTIAMGDVTFQHLYSDVRGRSKLQRYETWWMVSVNQHIGWSLATTRICFLEVLQEVERRFDFRNFHFLRQRSRLVDLLQKVIMTSLIMTVRVCLVSGLPLLFAVFLTHGRYEVTDRCCFCNYVLLLFVLLF